MPAFRVTLEYTVSQALEVDDAENAVAAIEEALGEVDTPNSTNRFNQSGDPVVVALYDESGESLPIPADYA